VTDAELLSLLRDTLALINVSARVSIEDDGITVQTADGTIVRIQRGAAPARWFITTARRRRPVPSVAALLEALRAAVGGEPGPRARFGAGASFASLPHEQADKSNPSDRAISSEAQRGDQGPANSPAEAPAPIRNAHDAIPVVLITGFLGSGKTTLVSRLLRAPSPSRTAIIVNEFGEIGLDHELIEHGDETLLELTNGCLCCAVQSSISRTLVNLERRRAAGEIAFDRVLIETSGLADPAPILHSLMTDDALGESYVIGSVVTLVDALLGAATLARHPEARRQVEFADRLICSKTDLVAISATLVAVLRELNPSAPLCIEIDDLDTLFAGGFARGEPGPIAQHTPRVASIVVERPAPIPAAALTLFVQSLAALAAGRLMRLKGIVELAEIPGQQIVLQGVENVFSPTTLLSKPATSRDDPARIVIIGQDIPRYFPVRLLDALIDEVIDEQAQRHISEVRTPCLAAPSRASSDIGRP
jgi:G3E family GTPase